MPTTTNTTAKVTGLTNGIPHVARVRSVGPGGNSTWEEREVTPNAPPPPAGSRSPFQHPHPSDDPFNMPIGVSAAFASASDPATQVVAGSSGYANVFSWTHPMYGPYTTGTTHTFTGGRETTFRGASENWQILSDSSTQPSPGDDAHYHVMASDGSCLESWHAARQSGSVIDAWRIVRGNLRWYSHSAGSVYDGSRGTRAWGGKAYSGLIRSHEMVSGNMVIPHALAISVMGLGTAGQGASGGVYDMDEVFPANEYDGGGYDPSYADAVRMGMKFAIPWASTGVGSDAWINGFSNLYVREFARCLRNYGVQVCDWGNPNVFYVQLHHPNATALNDEYHNNNGQLTPIFGALRRVLGTSGSLSTPTESNWNAWRNASPRQGWGGGTPVVPYSSELAV